MQIKSIFCATAALLSFSFSHALAKEYHHDIVIYGGTSAAVTTAVQATQMGRSVVIVSPDKHLGGLTAGGLGWTDSGNKNAIGGLSGEFYHRVWKHYQKPSAWNWEEQAKFGNKNQSGLGGDGDEARMWVFEPHVAEQIYDNWVAEEKIPVYRDQWLDRDGGVVSKAGRIESIRTLKGDVFHGKMFIDVTYEGDLMATAGVDYHVGREANAVYGETWNGNQVGVLHHAHWFKEPIDPYLKSRDIGGELLPGISDEPPGTRGEGDHRVQAYCFRMCLTNVPENRIPFPKPEGYDRARYQLLVRVFDAGWREMFRKFDPMPNYKTDTNNHGPFSTDNIGMNYDYPDADYERRQEIIEEHKVYQQGLMYFMANDPKVPLEVREAMSKWGLPKDEFLDNGGWPHQLYIREARRMIGEYVMTEHDCLDRKETPDSVGMGSYTLDSHNVRRYVTADGQVQNEGDIGVHTPRPYKVAYGALVPKKAQCENLLVPVCVSSSHIAFGSIRMEPVFMILGQSAATAACIALERGEAVQDVPYDVLQQRLVADGQVLQLEDPHRISSRKLPGVVVDDHTARLIGRWEHSGANTKYVDSGYVHNQNEQPGEKVVRFQTELKPGRYEVRVSYPPNNNRATAVPVKVTHAQGDSTHTVNQRKPPEIDGLFTKIGVFNFDRDATVEVGTRDADGYVVVDAVQFLPVPK
ncbi:Xanthan lyase precursor [Rosistilla carotiformis]|uniref:Xanthan lyase n=1 Tax=Rosistilla carotiformis TaxID=2528017 RepID=A0A518JYW8_9BACT|nr:FAD-dependent oxidoreductase [Rosistilla carotiformis]QDV70742.1 Xanthan lyase precursor [Rosistilla carotiformis]